MKNGISISIFRTIRDAYKSIEVIGTLAKEHYILENQKLNIESQKLDLIKSINNDEERTSLLKNYMQQVPKNDVDDPMKFIQKVLDECPMNKYQRTYSINITGPLNDQKFKK